MSKNRRRTTSKKRNFVALDFKGESAIAECLSDVAASQRKIESHRRIIAKLQGSINKVEENKQKRYQRSIDKYQTQVHELTVRIEALEYYIQSLRDEDAKLDMKRRLREAHSNGEVITINVEEYIRRGADQTPDQRPEQENQSYLTTLPSDTLDEDDYEILAPELIEIALELNDHEELQRIWQDDFDAIPSRAYGAKILSKLRFLSQIDKKEKPWESCMHYELLAELPDLPDISTTDTSLNRTSDVKILSDPYIVETGIDLRQTSVREQVIREGQAKFRKELFEHYGAKCMVSGEAFEAVLDAAHILPYNGIESNKLSNGLVLRTDIHRLFDAGLMKIHPADLLISFDPKLMNTGYAAYEGNVLLVGKDEDVISRKALLAQWDATTKDKRG